MQFLSKGLKVNEMKRLATIVKNIGKAVLAALKHAGKALWAALPWIALWLWLSCVIYLGVHYIGTASAQEAKAQILEQENTHLQDEVEWLRSLIDVQEGEG
jgi:hypothetical protein